MIGVRMGERALQIDVSDLPLTTAIAAKPGLSGQSTLVVNDEQTAERVRTAASESGLLVDLHVTRFETLPFAAAAFDVVIFHQPERTLAPLDPIARARVAAECHRVLRTGGRLIALDRGAPTGLAALLRRAEAPNPAYEASGGTAAILRAGGFTTVRILAEREGYRFVEALKT